MPEASAGPVGRCRQRPSARSFNILSRLFARPCTMSGAGAFACQLRMFYRRRLPHWHPDITEETFLFVTWRLAGTLPRSQPKQLAGESACPTVSAGRAFLALDREMDKAAFGPVWLRDARVASVVADALLRGDSGRHFYRLRAWVIMPNHVHVVLRPKTVLAVITRWLKGSTARQANLILGRTGRTGADYPVCGAQPGERWSVGKSRRLALVKRGVGRRNPERTRKPGRLPHVTAVTRRLTSRQWLAVQHQASAAIHQRVMLPSTTARRAPVAEGRLPGLPCHVWCASMANATASFASMSIP